MRIFVRLSIWKNTDLCYNDKGDIMYAYIKGIITIIEANYIVIENNGIGYLVYVANPYSFELETEYKIYIYEQVREDEHTLYGFKEKEEKDLFLRLINSSRFLLLEMSSIINISSNGAKSSISVYIL